MHDSAKVLIGYTDRPIVLSNQKALAHQIDIVENLEGLRELRSEWDQIAPASNVEPWQSFSWIEAAAVAYSRHHSLRIITIRKQGRLVAIAPMVLKPSEQPLNPMQLHFLGGEELKEPNRFIYNDDQGLDLLLDVIVSQPAFPIRLSRVPLEDKLLERLLKKFKNAGWIVRIKYMPYPYIDLTGKIIKKSLKEDLRRAGKKAKSFGNPIFDFICETNENELRKHLQKGFQIEASGWKGKNNTAILSNESRRSFFERYARASMVEGTLRLSFLYVDKKAVAVQYAIETMKNCWLLNVGYDEAFGACSPGNLLLERSIKTAVEKGMKRYNLLGKEEAWTKRWTRNTENCIVLAAYRPNLKGAKSILSDALYLVQKRFKDHRKEHNKKHVAPAR